MSLRTLRRLTGAVILGTVLVVPVAVAQSASAATNTSGGIRVTTPGSTTAYNGGKVYVKPTVTVKSGVHKTVTAKRITAYAGSRKVSSGTRVHLAAGTYKVQTKVSYRSYKLVTKTRTTTTRIKHDPDDGSPTSNCTITAITYVDPDDASNDEVRAGCTSRDYPGETVSVLGCNEVKCDSWCPDQIIGYDKDFNPVAPAVGDKYTGNVCATFKPYYTTKTTITHYQVKVTTGRHSYTTPKRALRVRNGGFRHKFVGSGIQTTDSFHVPHSTWHIHYSYNCSNFGSSGNFIIDVYKGRDYFDSAANRLSYSGSGTNTEYGAGTFHLEMDSECNWTVTVT